MRSLLIACACLLIGTTTSIALEGTVIRDGNGRVTHVLAVGAEDAYREGDFETALREFDEAVELMLADGMEPGGIGNLSRYIVFRTGALFHLGRKDEAAAEILRLDGEDFFAGLVAHQPGVADILIETMSHRLTRDPDDAAALRLRGDAYANESDYEEAVADYTRLVELARTPEDAAAAYDSRSWPLRLLDRDEEALLDLDRAVIIMPDVHSYRSNRAQVHVSLGNKDKAIGDFSKAIERLREMAEAQRAAGQEVEHWLKRGPVTELLARGKLLRETGAPEEALADLDALLELEPSHLEAFIERMLVRFELVQDVAALEDVKALRESNAERLEEIKPQILEIFEARMVPEIAGKAWQMGAAVTMVPILHLTGRSNAETEAMWGQVSQEIAEWSAANPDSDIAGLSPMPALSGEKREQLQTTIGFISEERAKLLAMVRSRDGVNIADVVAVSGGSHLARALHQLGMRGGSEQLAEYVRSNAEDASLPAEIWKPFVEAVKTGGDVDAAWPGLSDGFKAYLEENAEKHGANEEELAAADAGDAPKGERIRVRHILVESEEQAWSMRVQLDLGVDFAELAEEESKAPDAAEGGDLGFIERGDIVPKLEEAAFALEPGEVSDPVKTQFGWHIIKVEERSSAAAAAK